MPFVATSGTVTGGTTSIGDETLPYIYNPIYRENEGPKGVYGNYVRGIDNYVSETARNIQVIGDYNSVGEGCENVILLNSSGCNVLGGLSNVTLMNSSGVTVSTDSSYYLGQNEIKTVNNNIDLFTSGTISSAQILTLNTNPVNLVPAPGAGYYLKHTQCILRNNFNSVAYGFETMYLTSTGTGSTGGMGSFPGDILTSTSIIMYTDLGSSVNARVYENKGIDLTAVANPTLGNSSFSYFIFYKKISF